MFATIQALVTLLNYVAMSTVIERNAGSRRREAKLSFTSASLARFPLQQPPRTTLHLSTSLGGHGDDLKNYRHSRVAAASNMMEEGDWVDGDGWITDESDFYGIRQRSTYHNYCVIAKTTQAPNKYEEGWKRGLNTS
jgi:hypothetical protein